MPPFRKAIVETAIITPSGALSPGPLSASSIAFGALVGVKGGIIVALGHLAVELPYFLLLIMLLGSVEERLRRARGVLDLAAGVFILFFSLLLFRDSWRLLHGNGISGGSTIGSGLIGAFITGVALTGLNMYFLLWWISVGRPIVEHARSLSSAGRMVVYAVHYSYDLGWLAVLAYIGYQGGRMGGEALAVVLALLGLVLVYYGGKFIASFLAVRKG